MSLFHEAETTIKTVIDGVTVSLTAKPAISESPQVSQVILKLRKEAYGPDRPGAGGFQDAQQVALVMGPGYARELAGEIIAFADKAEGKSA